MSSKIHISNHSDLQYNHIPVGVYNNISEMLKYLYPDKIDDKELNLHEKNFLIRKLPFLTIVTNGILSDGEITKMKLEVLQSAYFSKYFRLSNIEEWITDEFGTSEIHPLINELQQKQYNKFWYFHTTNELNTFMSSDRILADKIIRYLQNNFQYTLSTDLKNKIEEIVIFDQYCLFEPTAPIESKILVD